MPNEQNSAISYSANFTSDGTSYLSLYGWTKGEHVREYYILENFGKYNPAKGAKKMGEFESDGSVYDVYQALRVNAPSIKGTRTFPQYWSVRREKSSSGKVTIGNHFNAWKSMGMPLGTHDYQIVATEGLYSQGHAAVQIQLEEDGEAGGDEGGEKPPPCHDGDDGDDGNGDCCQ